MAYRSRSTSSSGRRGGSSARSGNPAAMAIAIVLVLGGVGAIVFAMSSNKKKPTPPPAPPPSGPVVIAPPPKPKPPDPPPYPPLSAEKIAAGKYDNAIGEHGENETGRVLRAVGRMQDELKRRTDNESAAREKERALAAESMRVKVGLDSVSGNVLLADKDNRIIYLNKASAQMFRKAATDFRRERPGFDPEKLIAGAELFDYACGITLSGLRSQHPDASEERVQEILRERLAWAERNQECRR